MELTKEYFDKHIRQLATKHDLEKQTEALMAFAEAQTQGLARMIAETIDAPMHERFDRLEAILGRATERIEVLERKVQHIEDALHITL